ncbi:MAG: non-canonical purine NTP pyrophosphatase [Helicobacteraceae bacterium]|nr:non-canonical purine NTP pyrophosphatase [Helicobacteraceae bacterium]
MKLILASANGHKAAEIAALLEGFSVAAYSELIAPITIDENGDSFAANALIKARAVFAALNDPSAVVISDDSGIIVPVLGEGVLGIRSARFAGENASDKENLLKLIGELKARGLERAYAYYEAAIALKTAGSERTESGRLEGEVIVSPRGANGFGYDPIFIPSGFDRTLGELSANTKASISHRAKALEKIKPYL